MSNDAGASGASAALLTDAANRLFRQHKKILPTRPFCINSYAKNAIKYANITNV
jgi:hypothetical protein